MRAGWQNSEPGRILRAGDLAKGRRTIGQGCGKGWRFQPLSLAKVRSVSEFIDGFLRGLQIGTVDVTVELDRINFSAQSHEPFHIVCATLAGWRVHARLLEVTNPAAVERVDGEGNCNNRENEIKKRHSSAARILRSHARTTTTPRQSPDTPIRPGTRFPRMA